MRKVGMRGQIAVLTALSTVAFGLGGCATRGPLHLYSLPADGKERAIVDTGGDGTTDVPSYLEADDELRGFAYDPYTDHFFLRLAPGNKIRVVDRPARKIKREFEVESDALLHGGDLAIRPRDGHVFFLASDGVVETTRLGKVVRTLPAPAGPLAGLAYDAGADHLWLLDADGQRLAEHAMDGERLREIRLERPAADSIGFDPEQREFYALLRDARGEIGVFDRTGKLVRTQRASGRFVDVGPRSFVRVF